MRKAQLRVLVTGATGVLGREVVAAASAAGYTVRAQSRRARGAAVGGRIEWVRADLTRAAGLADALHDVHIIVHAATDPRNAAAVDTAGTERLLEEAQRQRVGHFVHVSIVGVDEIPLDYYWQKFEAERAVVAGGVRYSIIRFTQFHTLLESLIRTAARLPLVIGVPSGVRIQALAPSEAAARLMRCIEKGPGGRQRDFGGPEVLTLREAAETWKRVHGVSKPILALPIGGALAKALRTGKNTTRNGDKGSITFEQWLGTR